MIISTWILYVAVLFQIFYTELLFMLKCCIILSIQKLAETYIFQIFLGELSVFFMNQ